MATRTVAKGSAVNPTLGGKAEQRGEREVGAKYHLLTERNPKTAKGRRLGYRTAALHLLPHKLYGKGNLCPNASKGCAKA
ncbi:MAG: hypothetical protein HC882_07620 [Acidobacteria bacterium]|nr:hypothetical protein [Acidobacteriota bacterium]